MGFFDNRGDLGPPPEAFRFGSSGKSTPMPFRWLGLAQFPSSAEQFQELHRKLLELALEFLEAILSKLRLG